jgi:ABC-type glycerol-3-phosphate transport system substrate-binding protein
MKTTRAIAAAIALTITAAACSGSHQQISCAQAKSQFVNQLPVHAGDTTDPVIYNSTKKAMIDACEPGE